MKNILLTLLTGLFISLTAFSQNFTLSVSGTVQMVMNNMITPVPNQAVNIMIDSTNTGYYYQNTVFTDQSGYYEDIISTPPDFTYGYIWASTFDSCMGQYQSQGQYFDMGINITSMDFNLCTAPPNPCMATFYYYQPDPADPYTFQFANQSTGNFTQVTWSFGDSTFSDEFGPIHTFPGPGTYYVCLTITDGMECNSTYCEILNTGYPPPPGGCESFILPTNMSGLTVDFEGYTVSQYETQYTWEFGDGATASGQYVTHTYPNPGMFVTTLQTVDATGCTFQTFTEIWVDGLNQGCSNFFTYEQIDSTTFTFSGIVYVNNGLIYPDSTSAWSWDFGDGTTGTGQTITHNFQENPAGGYTVCLTTTVILPDGSLCTASYCEQVNLVLPSFNIYGYVYVGNMVADYGIVHLMTMDSLGQNVIEVGTAFIDPTGLYSFPEIPEYNRCLYYVQAELTQESQYFGQYLPTYHESSLTWEEAIPVMPLMNLPANIYMIPAGQLQSGEGVISGTVEELGTRGFMNDVEIVLMDPDKNPLAYMKSDEQGSFVFDGLAFGTYIIHAELMGIHTVQAQVTLSTDLPEASVEVQVTGDQANIVFGVPDQKSVIEKVGEIYPDPVNNDAKLDIAVIEPVNLSISIFGQTGQLMDVRGISLSKGSHLIELETANLPAGLYLARITGGNGEILSRKFMKIN